MKEHSACLSREKVLNSLSVLRIVLHILEETSLKSRNLGDGQWQWAMETCYHARKLFKKPDCFKLEQVKYKNEERHSRGALTEAMELGTVIRTKKQK